MGYIYNKKEEVVIIRLVFDAVSGGGMSVKVHGGAESEEGCGEDVLMSNVPQNATIVEIAKKFFEVIERDSFKNGQCNDGIDWRKEK